MMLVLIWKKPIKVFKKMLSTQLTRLALLALGVEPLKVQSQLDVTTVLEEVK